MMAVSSTGADADGKVLTQASGGLLQPCCGHSMLAHTGQPVLVTLPEGASCALPSSALSSGFPAISKALRDVTCT